MCYLGPNWLTPVILVTQEAEIKRITVWGQPRQLVSGTLFQKYSAQKSADRMFQVVQCLRASMRPWVQKLVLPLPAKKRCKCNSGNLQGQGLAQSKKYCFGIAYWHSKKKSLSKLWINTQFAIKASRTTQNKK
jgi:hypothetical protein